MDCLKTLVLYISFTRLQAQSDKFTSHNSALMPLEHNLILFRTLIFISEASNKLFRSHWIAVDELKLHGIVCLDFSW